MAQRIIIVFALLFSVILSTTSAFAIDKSVGEKSVYGRIERVEILPEGFIVDAKLDTGAKMSSLDAQNIKLYKKNGSTWVDFEITPNHFESKKLLHYKLERYINIKNRHQEASKSSMQKTRRPVIKIRICVMHQQNDIEVNLIDRSEFIYPMLLGRDAMEKFRMLIDPSEKFTTDPACGNL